MTDEPTMRDVRGSVVLLVLGLVGIVLGLSSTAPLWLMAPLAWAHGCLCAITLADYRAILRKRSGVLTR